MTREEFDVYLKKFNSRDYEGFLDYFADQFEMIHVGGSLKTRESVMKFYNFLHAYIKESVIVDRFVSGFFRFLSGYPQHIVVGTL